MGRVGGGVGSVISAFKAYAKCITSGTKANIRI